MTPKKNERKKSSYIQGAVLSLDDRAVLKREARNLDLRSATTLATKILSDWIQKIQIERAHEIIREAKEDHGKKAG